MATSGSFRLFIIIFIILGFVGLSFLSIRFIPKIIAKLNPPAVYHQVVTAKDYVDPKQVAAIYNKDGKVSFAQPGQKALLPGAKWVPQTFNNCGPATVSMLLQYFGYSVGQDQTQAKLRTGSDDRNVFTAEIKDYLKKDYNIDSKLLYNGNLETLKTLIQNGFYVLVEDTLHPNEDIGHFTIIRGFDDSQGVLIADDSYLGTNITYKYEEFDQHQWNVLNREFLPVYTADREPVLNAILGKYLDQKAMFEDAVKFNQAEVEKNPKDMYGWFNLGTSYFGLKEYDKAEAAFDKSRSLGWPFRILWYQDQPVQTANALGHYQKAIELAELGLNQNDSYNELHFQEAVAYKGLGDKTKAVEQLNKALYYSPNYQEAKDLLSSLMPIQ